MRSTTISALWPKKARTIGQLSTPTPGGDCVSTCSAGSGFHAAIRAKFEDEYGFLSSELAVRPPRHALQTPALVVHDRDDREVPYASAERIVRGWPEATLVTTTGLGHRRILRDLSVIERVVAFAAERVA